MNWTSEKPTAPGMYVYKRDHYFTYHFLTVGKGQWQKAQNPEEVYVDGITDLHSEPRCRNGLLKDLAPGMWFGPIPPVLYRAEEKT